MAQQIRFGYWGIRGAGQVARLLLAYTGANWQDVQYVDRNQWYATDKPTLGFDYPNLPYLIDGDFKLTQSKAIERYIIDRSDKKQLVGKTVQDQARVNQILGVLTDARTPLAGLFWDKEYEAKLQTTWDKIKPKLDLLEKNIGNNDFALGYLTYADFNIAEISNYFEKAYPEEYKKYPSFQRIRDNFNNLAEIKKYYESEKSMKGPFLPPDFAVIKL